MASTGLAPRPPVMPCHASAARGTRHSRNTRGLRFGLRVKVLPGGLVELRAGANVKAPTEVRRLFAPKDAPTPPGIPSCRSALGRERWAEEGSEAVNAPRPSCGTFILIVFRQIHARVKAGHLVAVAVEHEGLALGGQQAVADAALPGLAPARVAHPRVNVGVEAVFPGCRGVPGGGGLLPREAYAHDGLDA